MSIPYKADAIHFTLKHWAVHCDNLCVQPHLGCDSCWYLHQISRTQGKSHLLHKWPRDPCLSQGRCPSQVLYLDSLWAHHVPTVKNQPLHVPKCAKIDKDTSMHEFIKCDWQYNLQKREASALIGRCIVSSTTPSNIQEDAHTLPQQMAKSQWLGSVSHD